MKFSQDASNYAMSPRANL